MDIYLLSAALIVYCCAGLGISREVMRRQPQLQRHPNLVAIVVVLVWPIYLVLAVFAALCGPHPRG